MRLLKTKVGKDLVLWYRSDDRYMGQRMALGKYEKYETELLLRQIGNNDVVIDVGANIGYYTVLMAKKVKKVYAFEPEKKNFEILQKNIKENNLTNVIAIRAVVGDKNGIAELMISKENLGDHKVATSFKKQPNGDDRQKMKCMRLDDVIKEKINLIKIDVQGWEPEVIRGAKRLIERDLPILFMEYTSGGYKNDMMINFLKKYYKNIWSINDFAEVSWPIFPGVKVVGRAGYADLWMKQRLDTGDYVTMLKNINYKKFIKGIMGLWQK